MNSWKQAEVLRIENKKGNIPGKMMVLLVVTYFWVLGQKTIKYKIIIINQKIFFKKYDSEKGFQNTQKLVDEV